MSILAEEKRPRQVSGLKALQPAPSHDQISVCPCSGNPYKCFGFHPIPTISGLLLKGSKSPTLMTNPRILVLIPARMAATRLPGKPLLGIAGLPMIVHVLRRAEAAAIGRVAVATDTAEIAAAVTAHGGEVVMTRADHVSGSDRIYEALGKIDPDGHAEIVVNLQGDFPTILPDNIRDVLLPLEEPSVDIATLAAEIHTEEEALNPNVVKAVGSRIGPRRLRALYFTRATAPYGEGPRYHHIGLYAYRRAALERFVRLKPSPLERQEKLEQLRALEAGMRIDVGIVDTVPRGVDTPADLETARQILSKN
jgi:3-deoxy-manno-octulosonate cytidylyltransferase (CMP-KDO synthetase)